MVLRDSGSSRCDCLAGVEEAELGIVDRIYIPHPCRDGSDSEAVCRRTRKARTLLVLETVENPEESDSHKCDHVPAGWYVGWLDLALERTVGRSGIEHRY